MTSLDKNVFDITYGIFITWQTTFILLKMHTKPPSSTVTCVVGDFRSWLHCKPIILFTFILHGHFDDFYSKCFMTINFGQLFIILYRKLDCSYSEFRWKWEQRFLFLYISSPCFKNHLIWTYFIVYIHVYKRFEHKFLQLRRFSPKNHLKLF